LRTNALGLVGTIELRNGETGNEVGS